MLTIIFTLVVYVHDVHTYICIVTMVRFTHTSEIPLWRFRVGPLGRTRGHYGGDRFTYYYTGQSSRIQDCCKSK